MRGSNAVEKSEVLPVSDSAVVPATFADALIAAGDRHENTILGADKRHRHGRIYLQMAGRLSVWWSLTRRRSSGLSVQQTGTAELIRNARGHEPRASAQL